MMLKEQIEEILSKAVFAPSGDNSQPWHFEVNNNEIKVYNYPEKDLPFYNHNQCGSYVAHGALIENIKLVASEMGYESDIKMFPKDDDKNLVAKITLIKNDGIEKDGLVDYITKRVTNRKPYFNEKISDEVKRSLESSVLDEDIILTFVEDKSKISEISNASVVNEKTVLKTKSIHEFFFKHVVWTEKEEKEKKSGLYVKTLEMPKPQEVAFKLASFWPIMKMASKLGIINKIAEDNSKLFQSSGAFAVFSVDGDSAIDFIKIGRSLQRVWLTCTKYQVSAHPVTGVLFLYQRVKSGIEDGLTSTQVAEIKNAYDRIYKTCSVNKKNILFILRIGRSESPSATSSKLDPVIKYL